MARGKRRHHGGTVRQLPSGRWQARVWDDGTGKHVSAGTFPTKADAQVALTQALADHSRGKWVAPDRSRVTVETYVRSWIDGHPKLGVRTRERYDGLLKHHIAPHIGKARLGDLTTATVRRWHAKLHTTVSPDTAPQPPHRTRARATEGCLNGNEKDGQPQRRTEGFVREVAQRHRTQGHRRHPQDLDHTHRREEAGRRAR